MDLLFSFGRVLFVSSWEEVEGQSKQPWFGWSAISVQEIKKARQNVHFSCAELQIEKKTVQRIRKNFKKKVGWETHTQHGGIISSWSTFRMRLGTAAKHTATSVFYYQG